MLSPRTDALLAAGLRRLKRDQESGKAPPVGVVSRAAIARRAGVSEDVIRGIERVFAARLAAAILRDPAAPTHLTRAAERFLAKL
jgi:hypothetical protein